MKPLDALFVHVPRFDGSRREIMVMATGVPAMANMLGDAGLRTEILHLGIESEEEQGFSLARFLADRRPRLVLLSLHWSGQTRPVLDVAERARRWLPEGSRIVLGGLTASVFAEELAGSLSFVDGVVCGDGEEPVRALARVVVEGRGSLDDVPNLVYRASPGGVVRRSPRRWRLDEEHAARLRHGSLALLRHAGAYVERALYADFSPGVEGSEGYGRAAYLNAGRGCTKECLCCGGAASSQRTTSDREGIVLYPVDKLLRDAEEAYESGARVLRTSFDPPGSRKRIDAWFRAIARSGLKMRLIFDAWQLPSRTLLSTMARAFEPGSVVVYSPECGNERIRKIVRPRSFSNDALLQSIAEAERHGLRAHVFFSAGLPGEEEADIEETLRLVGRIRRETGAAVSATPMFVDPASPLFDQPERYGVTLVRRRLQDFYDERGVPGGPGYETEHFDERGILGAVRRVLGAARR